MRTRDAWLWMFVASCTYASDLVPCGDLVCPAGSTCTSNHLCNNPLLPDRDEDGVMDTIDNCIDIANTDQSDIDEDRVGDECDNCPLVANSGQAAVGDDDALGDACDPRPTEPGDCLVLVDAFRVPEQFALHWRKLSPPAESQVQPGTGHLDVTPLTANPASFAALDAGAQPLMHIYNVQSRASGMLGTGGFTVVTGLDLQNGYGCTIAKATAGSVVEIGGMATSSSSALLSTPVGNDIALLLRPPTAPNTNVICLAQYGLALGVTGQPVSVPLVQGYTGFAVNTDPVRVLGIALIESGAGTTCAPTLYR